MLEFYVNPMRKAGYYTITMKVSDVVKEMEKAPAIPAVFAMLGSDVFEKEAVVKRIAVDGPTNGANALFVYRLK